MLSAFRALTGEKASLNSSASKGEYLSGLSSKALLD